MPPTFLFSDDVLAVYRNVSRWHAEVSSRTSVMASALLQSGERSAWADLGPLLQGTAEFGYSPGMVWIRVDENPLLRVFSGASVIRKNGGQLLVSHVRLRPPWISTLVRLDARAAVWIGALSGRSIAEKLRAAGFEVIEERVRWQPSRPPLEGKASRRR